MPSTAASSPVHVAVGLLLDRDQVFITRRAANTHQGGKWEFPGGKLDDNEPVETALKRELLEELGIEVRKARPWMQVRHRYPDREVLLDVWHITAWDGTPHGREGQEARWASVRELPKLDFPEADLPILRRLWLPLLYLISDAARLGRDEFLQRLEQALKAGGRLVQLREPGMPVPEFRALAIEVAGLCRRHDARLLLNADPSLVEGCGADGVHLNSHRLMALKERPLSQRFFVGASCHDARELAQAVAIGADLAVLGPVARTASHPQAAPLGWERFTELCRGERLPVYALGGMQPADLAAARQAGARGVAMIRGIWDAANMEQAVAACADS
ncbi:MAG: Nudix family hydrolase [Gammaproteobacteria bacterium]|nr:MAG: Nudix family hydrolase [Gammaproteobacteria bacterium]